MCAYNVRRKSSTNNIPAQGEARFANLLRELLVFGLCAGAMYLVYLVGRRFLR